ncbi:hypothetical protein [Martelella limonii]|uniref:hypothetical protein n=1 Tax=Martelella limonii TaxID=1647649 RepID=UPI0015804A76|nr:hypothetical protein [Martelella limonii]
MPIAQIIVSEPLVPVVRQRADALTAEVVRILTADLFASPDLVQVVLTSAIAPAFGKDVLCQVFHRATDARTSQVRADAAKALRLALERLTGGSVRVRLMALEPAIIAASDTQGTL